MKDEKCWTCRDFDESPKNYPCNECRLKWIRTNWKEKK